MKFERLESGQFLFFVPLYQLIAARKTGKKTHSTAELRSARADKAQKCLHTWQCGGAGSKFTRRLATHGQDSRHRSTAKVSQWRADDFAAHLVSLSVHISSKKAPGPPTRTVIR